MTDKIFDQFDFHDNLIRGISFNCNDFMSEVHIDLDHILKWPLCKEENADSFVLSKANLIFENVTDLKISIDWGESNYTSSSSCISINRIERENVDTTLRFVNYYRYSIIDNSEKNVISFGASTQILKLIGNPMTVNRQYLTNEERGWS